LNVLNPNRGRLRGHVQWAQQPEQNRTNRVILDLAARGGTHNVERQDKTKTRAEKDLVLTKKSEHGRLFRLQQA
jgi:hypothetical protein